MIAIFVNGSHLSIDAGTDVSGLVDALGIARKGVAVAVNDEVVPRSLWLTSLVHEGDRVEILTAVQGG